MLLVLKRLNLPLVIDHMGRMNTSRGVNDPGFQFLCQQLSEGAIWTKISGADRITSDGPTYADVDPFAEAILAANDEHVVRGRSEEHTSELQSLMRISYAVLCLIQNINLQITLVILKAT